MTNNKITKIDVNTCGYQTSMPNEVLKFIADKLTEEQIAEVNEFIAKRNEMLQNMIGGEEEEEEE